MSTELVLLIEDNHEHATLIQALLDFRALDSPVFVTASVAEAEAYLGGEWPFDNRQRHPLPGLIVLDHWLLDGTGLEILEWLQDFDELSRFRWWCSQPAWKKAWRSAPAHSVSATSS